MIALKTIKEHQCTKWGRYLTTLSDLIDLSRGFYDDLGKLVAGDGRSETEWVKHAQRIRGLEH